jgi:hypothetical protein
MNSNYSMPMNIGNPDEYTIEQFAIKIKDLVGRGEFVCFFLNDFIDIFNKDHKRKLSIKILLLMIQNNVDLI